MSYKTSCRKSWSLWWSQLAGNTDVTWSQGNVDLGKSPHWTADATLGAKCRQSGKERHNRPDRGRMSEGGRTEPGPWAETGILLAGTGHTVATDRQPPSSSWAMNLCVLAAWPSLLILLPKFLPSGSTFPALRKVFFWGEGRGGNPTPIWSNFWTYLLNYRCFSTQRTVWNTRAIYSQQNPDNWGQYVTYDLVSSTNKL